MSRYPGALAVMIALATAGCDRGYAPLEGDAAWWFPMQVGSSWLYGAEGCWWGGQDVYDITGSREVSIVGDTLHEIGFPLLTAVISDSLVYTPVGGGDAFTEEQVDTLFLLSTGSGVFVYDALDDEACHTRLLLPVIPGNTWVDGAEHSTVVSGSTWVDGPDGGWSDCIQIRTSSPVLPGLHERGACSGYWHQIDRFYAGGIGLVREELLGNGGVDSAELVFTLADSGV